MYYVNDVSVFLQLCDMRVKVIECFLDRNLKFITKRNVHVKFYNYYVERFTVFGCYET